jgi:non-ribosomal peptide synthetase component F
MFVNTLALRNFPHGEQTFRKLLEDVKKRTLDAFENQDYQFEDLVEKVVVGRDAGRNALFDVMFVLQNIDMLQGDRGKNEIVDQSVHISSPGDYENILQVSKFDLTLIAVTTESSLLFSFQYCTKLFKKKTIEIFIDYFKTIVSAVAADEEIQLKDITFADELVAIKSTLIQEDTDDFDF